MNPIREETQLAIRAVSIAQAIADSRAGADRVTSKGGIDLVTDTDLACEDAVRSELGRAASAYPVVGEERAGTPRPGEPYWLVDPICGTRLFASNIPLYCTNIALVENGEVTLAAIGIGKSGEIVYAERGRGARLRTANRDEPIAVSEAGNAIWVDGSTEQSAEALRNFVLLNRWFVWRYSSSVAYAHMAMGRVAAVVQFHHPKMAPAPYGSVHAAAGLLVAHEAGAIVTDLDNGEPWKLTTRSFVMAASRKLHDELMGIVS